VVEFGPKIVQIPQKSYCHQQAGRLSYQVWLQRLTATKAKFEIKEALKMVLTGLADSAK